MTVRTIDDIFRDFVIDGVPASGPFNPFKPDIRDTLKALLEGITTFPDNRVIRLNNANSGTPNNIVVTASVAIPAAAYQVLYILNVTQENTGAVTVSGAINRTLVTNTSRPIEPGYLQPGMALLCIDTGTELRLLSYGDAEAILTAAEEAAARAEAAAAGLNLPTIKPGDAGKSLIVNPDEDGYELGSSNAGEYESRAIVEETNVPETARFLRTAGYYAPGDGGGALYKRVATQPTHAGKVQSADGAWWELAQSVVHPEIFGAKGDGESDDTNAIQDALSFGVEVNFSREYLISGEITAKSVKGPVMRSASNCLARIIHSTQDAKFILAGEGTRVEGIHFDPIGVAIDRALVIGDPSIGASRGTIVKGCRFGSQTPPYHFSVEVEFFNVWYSSIVENYSLGTNEHPDAINIQGNYSVNIVVQGNHAEFTGLFIHWTDEAHPVQGYQCEGWQIVNNIVAGGYRFFHGEAGLLPTIANNVIDLMKGESIRFESNVCFIIGNWINSASGNTDVAVVLDGYDHIISGNRIDAKDSGKPAVFLRSEARQITINNNIIIQGTTAIQCEGAPTALSINNNILENQTVLPVLLNSVLSGAYKGNIEVNPASPSQINATIDRDFKQHVTSSVINLTATETYIYDMPLPSGLFSSAPTSVSFTNRSGSNIQCTYDVNASTPTLAKLIIRPIGTATLAAGLVDVGLVAIGW